MQVYAFVMKKTKKIVCLFTVSQWASNLVLLVFKYTTACFEITSKEEKSNNKSVERE